MPPSKPTRRVQSRSPDVWSFINAAAAASPIQPISNMGQGFFGYNPPAFILDAARASIDRTDTYQYAPPKGRPSLKQALATTYSPLFARELDPATEILITTGANEGIFSALTAYVEPCDEVLVIEPFFDFYIGAIKVAGGVPVYVSLDVPPDGAASAAEWTIDAAKVEEKVTARAKILILNTPHNPTGKVFTRTELSSLADVCIRHSILILVDEVYDTMSFTPFVRIGSLSPEAYAQTLTVGSAGKTFYATGWRVGHVIGPADLIEPVAEAHRLICYSSPSASQQVVAAAHEAAHANGFFEWSRKEIERKMTFFNEVWTELGIRFTAPEGGYFVLVDTRRIAVPDDYVFPPHLINKTEDYKLAYFLIQELGVATIPLSEFYSEANKAKATSYLRFAVCKSDEDLDLAKKRLLNLKKFLK